MPELPEVETVKNILKPLLVGHTIESVDILYTKMILKSDLDFCSSLINKKFIDVKRIGKYLILILSDNLAIISHLRMEGKYILLNDNETKSKYSRVIFHLDKNVNVSYDDSRCFGIMKLVRTTELDKEEMLTKLGPEPMQFNNELEIELFKKLQRSNLPIKVSIMDQSNISGLGNIYADEVLFASKIHPLTPSKLISLEQVHLIITNSIRVLNKAIELGGSTIKSYHAARGVDGKFQNELLVYGKKGSNCPNCGYPFKKIRIGGRGTTFCPCCQKYPNNTIVIAIVGKIASGKSTALNYFKSLEYNVISADEIVKNLYSQEDGINKIKRHFALAVINNHINTSILRDIVINNPTKKKQLESIVHPLVENTLNDFIHNSNTKYTFIEVPLLFESHMDYLADYIIGITASKEVQVEHLIKRGVKNVEEYLKLNDTNTFDTNISKMNFIVSPNDDIKVFENSLKNIIDNLN